MKRFFDKVKKTDSCWNWIAAIRGKTGYGCMKFQGKIIDAHRISWILHNGDIPEGLLVCHTCDNRKCVNPNHLFLGTYKDNMQDCKNKGRVIVPENEAFRFKKGHYPKNTKIPLNIAIQIKNEITNRGKRSLKSISTGFEVPYQYVRDISCGRILKNQ